MTIKVLVTGTHGQLARALAERAREYPNLALFCVGRPELELADPKTIEQILKGCTPDVVVSAASFTEVEGAEETPETARRINVAGIGSLAAAARDASARMIHISTDYVFDGTKGRPYEEHDPPHPLSVYGATKWDGEDQVRRRLPEHVILRTAWLYSPFGKNFVKTMLSLAKTRTKLSVIDDQTGNPTSAFDLADAILTVLARWRSDPVRGLGETFHCAGTGATTWFGFAEEIFVQSRVQGGPIAEVAPIATADWPAKARRPRNAALNCDKFETFFGWRAPQWETSLGPVVARLVRTTP